LIYTSNKIIISINGEEIFNEDGCYKPGLFGLYSFNQNGTIYQNVVYEQYYEINLNNDVSTVCEEISVGFNFMDTSCSDIPNSLTSYEWNFGDGSPTSTEISPLHYFENSGLNIVELYITDINSCTDTISKAVYVNPKAAISAHPQDVDCSVGDAITFSITADNAAMYQWYIQEDGINYWSKLHNNGYYSGVNTSELHVFNVRPNYDHNKYRCVVIGLCDNPVTSSHGELFIDDIPVRAELGTTLNHICTNDSMILLLTLKELFLIKSAKMRINYDTNSFEVSGYTSYFQDINFSLISEENHIDIEFSPYHPIELNEAILASINIKAKGEYSGNMFFLWDEEYTYFIDENSDTINNYLYNTSILLDDPFVSDLDDTISICDGNTIDVNEDLFNTINWSTGDNGPSTTIKNEGNYWVDLIDRNSCHTVDSFYVIPIEIPQNSTAILPDKSFYCEYDQTIEFSVEDGSGSYMRYSYLGNTIIDSTFTSSTYQIQNPGSDFEISVSWYNSCGETQEIYKTIPVYPLAEPKVMILKNSTEINLGDQVEFTALAEGVGEKPYFIWRLNNTVVQSGLKNKYITNELKDNEELRLSLYSDAHCLLNGNYAEDRMRILLNDNNDFFIPSLVILNGSSYNDSFKVVFRRDKIYNFLLQVFDLRGRLVFETEDRFDSWDGRNVKIGSYGMYTYRLMYSKVPIPNSSQVEIVSGKFLLKK